MEVNASGDTSAHKAASPASTASVGTDTGTDIIGTPVSHEVSGSKDESDVKAKEDTADTPDNCDGSLQLSDATTGTSSSDSGHLTDTDPSGHQSRDTSSELVKQSMIESSGQNKPLVTNPSTVPSIVEPKYDYGSRDIRIARRAFRLYGPVRRDTLSAAAPDIGQDAQTTRENGQLDASAQQETSGNTKNSQSHSTSPTALTANPADSVQATDRPISPAISELTSLFTGGEPGPDVGPWKRVSGRGTLSNHGTNHLMPSMARPVSPICVRESISRQAVHDGDLDEKQPSSAHSVTQPDASVHDDVPRELQGERLVSMPRKLVRFNDILDDGPDTAAALAAPEGVEGSQMKSRPAPLLCVRKASSNQSLADRNKSHWRSTSARALTSPFQLDDRPIFVTNAMDYIIYDGPCEHCKANGCPCRNPSASSSSSSSSSGVTPRSKIGIGGGRIITEGFCRHCVWRNCSCIQDPQWGQHHAKAAQREARFQSSMRLLSDTGTVRRYDTIAPVAAPTEPGEPQVAVPQPVRVSGNGSQSARNSEETGRENENAGGSANNEVNSIADSVRDLEAQDDPNDDTHSVSIFRMPRSDRTRPRGPPEPPKRGFVDRYFCQAFIVLGCAIILAVAGVIIWLFCRARSAAH